MILPNTFATAFDYFHFYADILLINPIFDKTQLKDAIKYFSYSQYSKYKVRMRKFFIENDSIYFKKRVSCTWKRLNS